MNTILAAKQEMTQLTGVVYLLDTLWLLLRENIFITLSFGGDFFTAMVHKRP